MKYASYGLLAAFLAQGVYAAIPTSAEGWYTPSSGFTRQSGSGTVWYLDENGNECSVPVNVDDKGRVSGGMSLIADTSLKTSYEALLKACANEAWNAIQDEAIHTIGENLYSLFFADGIQMVMDKQGPGGSKTEATYTLRIQPGSGGGGATIEATDPIPYGRVVDGKSIGWTQQNAQGQLAIYGVGSADSGQIAYANGMGGITWGYPFSDILFDDVTVTTNGTGKAHLVGWAGGNECNTDLSTILTEESDSNRSSHYVLTRYGEGNDAVFHYVPMGDRLDTGGGSPVDCESITTNASEGASSQGDASLYGWSTAQAEDIPQKSDEGTLKWTSPEDMVDGSSLAWTELQGVGKVWEVKDAHVYGGKHAKHYFGTSVDKEAALGWHELPNISTNRVEGDEVTISSDPNIPGQGDDPEVKKIGLKGWNYSLSGEPLFVANNNGAIDYMSLSSLTNLAACACTNKWLALIGWIQDGELDSNNGITFESESMDYYMWHDLGYIYSTTPDNLYFDNDGSDIQASFDAPQNWADDISIEEKDGVYQIMGFDNASACGASMSAMLSDPTGSDATTHLILAKKTDTGDLHYVPLGSGVAGGGEHADGVTIVTNTAQGAATQGLLSLYGWSSAQDGKVLTKKNNAVSWEDGGTPPDDVTLAVVTEGTGAQATEKLSIKGFEAAENGSIPWKNENGEFVWGGESTVTNRILAGAGINITDNGGGAITISAQAFNNGNVQQSLSVITDIQYDEEEHKLQVKRKTITFTGSVSSVSDEWEDIFEAVSHSSEHTSGQGGNQ